MASLSAELRSSETWWIDHFDGPVREGWLRHFAERVRTVEAPTGPVHVSLDAKQVCRTFSNAQPHAHITFAGRVRDRRAGRVYCVER